MFISGDSVIVVVFFYFTNYSSEMIQKKIKIIFIFGFIVENNILRTNLYIY